MSKRSATTSATEVSAKTKKEDRPEEHETLRTSLLALTKEALVEKCMEQSTEVDRLASTLTRSQRLEQLAKIRYTLKDREHRAMAQEQCNARWKLLGDPQSMVVNKRGLQMEAFVQETIMQMRDELHGARRDLDSARTELHTLRGKASEENSKEWERTKRMKEESERLRVDAKKKASAEKELAIAQKACHLYKQQIRELEKELAERNARIRLLEEEPKATEENGEEEEVEEAMEEVNEEDTAEQSVEVKEVGESVEEEEEEIELDEDDAKPLTIKEEVFSPKTEK